MRHTKHYDKDLYSKWHRKYEGIAFIDIDSVEVCPKCYEPLALIETAYYKGSTYKNTYLTKLMADRLGIPSYLVFYMEDKTPVNRSNLSLEQQELHDRYDWVSLRFVWRNLSKSVFHETSEDKWLDELFKLHIQHRESGNCGKR